eukprot:6403423-Amphidinium_carterae.1
MARGLVPGDVVHLRYEEEDLWHERILTGRSVNGRWAVCTPDYDHYVETVEAADVPLRIGRGGWHLANGLGRDRGEPVYRFDPARRPRGARLRALCKEAVELIRVDALDQAVAAPVVAQQPLGLEPDSVWICLISPEGAEIGGSCDGAWGSIANLHSGVEGQKDRAEDKLTWLRKQWGEKAGSAASTLDARILPVERNALGQRFRDVRSAVALSRQEDLPDFPLEGPRTARWWAEQVSRTGMTPGTRHKQWRHENGLDAHDGLC